MKRPEPLVKAELPHQFSSWSEEEKERLLTFLHNKYILIKKTDIFKVIGGSLLLFVAVVWFGIELIGGIGSYINNQVSLDLNGTVERSLLGQISQSQIKAQNDANSLDQMVALSQQRVLKINKDGWENVKINSLAVENLNIVDSKGNRGIDLGTDIDNSDGPAIDFFSTVPLQTTNAEGVTAPVTIHIGQSVDHIMGHGLFIDSSTGQLMLAASVEPCDCPVLDLFDKSGYGRLILDIDDVNDTPISTANILMYNRKDKPIFQAYESDNSDGILFTGDKNGNSTSP